MGTLREWTGAATDATGYADDDPKSMTLADLIAARDADRTSATGRETPDELSVRRLPDDSDAAVAVVATAQPGAERERHEEVIDRISDGASVDTAFEKNRAAQVPSTGIRASST